MHFGKLLRVTTSQMPEVEQILSCYKAGKKIIKNWAQHPCELDQRAKDSAFVDTLCSHLNDFNSKWEESALACKAKFACLQQQVATACSAEDMAALHGQVLNLHGEVLLTMHWSMLAYTGLVKIMKKYHKRTSSLLHFPDMMDLLSHTFCRTEGVSNLLSRVAALLEQLSKDVGLHAGAQGATAAISDDCDAAQAAFASAAGEADTCSDCGNASSTPGCDGPEFTSSIPHAAASAGRRSTAAHGSAETAPPGAAVAAAAVPASGHRTEGTGACDAKGRVLGQDDAGSTDTETGDEHASCGGDSSHAGHTLLWGEAGQLQQTQNRQEPCSAELGCSTVREGSVVRHTAPAHGYKHLEPDCFLEPNSARCKVPGEARHAVRSDKASDDANRAPCKCVKNLEGLAAALARVPSESGSAGPVQSYHNCSANDSVWERLCAYDQHIQGRNKLVVQTQMALDTWLHISHSKTPAPVVHR